MKSRYFLLLLLLSILLNFLLKYLLINEEIYYNTFIDKLSIDQVEEFIDSQKKWEWLGYVLIPLFLLIKIYIVAAVLDLGCFFFDREIKYSRLFNLVVRAEFIFLLVIILKIVWFYVFQQDYSLEDLQYFYPLSVLSIIGYSEIETWFIYPLQTLNLFEMLYWVVLAYLIGKAVKISTSKSLAVVASSYGVALVIWVVTIMFLTLNMS